VVLDASLLAMGRPHVLLEGHGRDRSPQAGAVSRNGVSQALHDGLQRFTLDSAAESGFRRMNRTLLRDGAILFARSAKDPRDIVRPRIRDVPRPPRKLDAQASPVGPVPARAAVGPGAPHVFALLEEQPRVARRSPCAHGGREDRAPR
jgi:hypothetical protein